MEGPRVAIMIRAAQGREFGCLERVMKSPGLETLWQLISRAAATNNVPDTFIAM